MGSFSRRRFGDTDGNRKWALRMSGEYDYPDKLNLSVKLNISQTPIFFNGGRPQLHWSRTQQNQMHEAKLIQWKPSPDEWLWQNKRNLLFYKSGGGGGAGALQSPFLLPMLRVKMNQFRYGVLASSVRALYLWSVWSVAILKCSAMLFFF